MQLRQLTDEHGCETERETVAETKRSVSVRVSLLCESLNACASSLHRFAFQFWTSTQGKGLQAFTHTHTEMLPGERSEWEGGEGQAPERGWTVCVCAATHITRQRERPRIRQTAGWALHQHRQPAVQGATHIAGKRQGVCEEGRGGTNAARPHF